MRLVLVEWLDSFGSSPRWEPLEDVRAEPMVCRSVGWLAYDGKDCKVVVPHVSTRHETTVPQGCGDMTIPVRAILRMTTLSEPPRKSRARRSGP